MVTLALLLAHASAYAQQAPASQCLALAQALPRVMYANLKVAASEDDAGELPVGGVVIDDQQAQRVQLLHLGFRRLSPRMQSCSRSG